MRSFRKIRPFTKRITIISSAANGFTLWEVLLVLCLLAVISYLLIPSITASNDHVKQQVNKSNILLIEKAASLYCLDTGSYPESITALVRNERSVSGWRGPYLEQIPTCPIDQNAEYDLNARGKVIMKSQ